jgi:hypothetical protein
MRVLDLDERLQRIEARQFIEDMLARYAMGGDRKNDPAIMGPLFAEDAVWTCEGFGRFEGRDNITAAVSAFAQTHILWSVHYMVSPLIEIDADLRTARCRWYLWELATVTHEGTPRDSWLCGWYDSQLRRINERWEFTYVELDIRLLAEASPPWGIKKPFDE